MDLRCPCGGALRVSFTRTEKGVYSFVKCLVCGMWQHASHVESFVPPWAADVGPMQQKVVVTSGLRRDDSLP